MKRAFYFSTAITLTLLLTSCCKAIFETETRVSNNFQNDIELHFYKAGQFEIQKLKANSREILIRTIVDSSYDSIRIFSQDLHHRTHYRNGLLKAPSDIKTINFNDPSNLFNHSSYIIYDEMLACDGKRTIERYSFN